MTSATNKPRRQIRDDAVLCEKAADACHDASATNPTDYTPIVQQEVNPKLKIPLRFELMTRDLGDCSPLAACAGGEANAHTRSSTPNRSGWEILRWG
jgi:hypothetical protein